jgi:hypothetical protein
VKFRKKPVVIEAMLVPNTDNPLEIGKLVGWFNAHGFSDWEVADSGQCLHLRTLEGVMRADIGDWIIRGVNGEFYPCKPDIFAKTYEKV